MKLLKKLRILPIRDLLVVDVVCGAEVVTGAKSLCKHSIWVGYTRQSIQEASVGDTSQVTAATSSRK